MKHLERKHEIPAKKTTLRIRMRGVNIALLETTYPVNVSKRNEIDEMRASNNNEASNRKRNQNDNGVKKLQEYRNCIAARNGDEASS